MKNKGLVVLGVFLLIAIAAGAIWMFSKSSGTETTKTDSSSGSTSQDNAGLGGVLGQIDLTGLSHIFGFK